MTTTKVRKRKANRALAKLTFRQVNRDYWYCTVSAVWTEDGMLRTVLITLCKDGIDKMLEVSSEAYRLHVTIYKRRPTKGATFCLINNDVGNPLVPVRISEDRSNGDIVFSSDVEYWLQQEIFRKFNIRRCYARVEWS